MSYSATLSKAGWGGVLARADGSVSTFGSRWSPLECQRSINGARDTSRHEFYQSLSVVTLRHFLLHRQHFCSAAGVTKTPSCYSKTTLSSKQRRSPKCSPTGEAQEMGCCADWNDVLVKPYFHINRGLIFLCISSSVSVLLALAPAS